MIIEQFSLSTCSLNWWPLQYTPFEIAVELIQLSEKVPKLTNTLTPLKLAVNSNGEWHRWKSLLSSH